MNEIEKRLTGLLLAASGAQINSFVVNVQDVNFKSLQGDKISDIKATEWGLLFKTIDGGIVLTFHNFTDEEVKIMYDIATSIITKK